MTAPPLEKRHRQRPPGAKAPGRKAVDLNARPSGGRTDAAVAEVMPERDEKQEGRRRARRSTRPGLAVFGAREKHRAGETYGGLARARGGPLRSNWEGAPDILDWHVAAIRFPFRSRGPAR